MKHDNKANFMLYIHTHTHVTFSVVLLLLLLLVIVLVVKLIFGYYLQITLPEILVPQFQVQFEIYRYVCSVKIKHIFT